MEYKLDLGAWSSVFAVPCALVDSNLKLAGKEQLQVILWMLRHGGESFSAETISALLGMSQDSALDAMDYWVDCGLLASSDGSFSAGLAETNEVKPEKIAAKVEKTPIGENEAKENVKKELPKQKRLIKPDGLYLSTRMKESEAIRYLMQEAEMTLGKTISPALSSALISVCDDYGLPVEVIIMILNYAKEVGKTGTSYIESVARDWSQSGIFTLEAAEEKLKELSERRLAWSKVEAAAGLIRRAPTKKEEDFAYRWTKEWNFSREMLVGAYERCAENTGKFSMSYMNKILENWQKKGITDISQAEAAEQQKKTEAEEKKSYDIDEFERMSFFNPPEEL